MSSCSARADGSDCGSRTSAAPITITRCPPRPRRRERVPRAESALEGRADQLGREPALHVGAGADAQEMKGDELRGIPESCSALGREGSVHRGPHRPEDLIAGAHADRDPLGGDALRVEDDGVDDDRAVVAVQVAEDAALGQDAGVPLGHLAPDDRLGARGVGLLLASREREDARRAVLDRDGRVEQRGDRVGDREQVARRQAADRLALRVADVAVREERPQERGELRPGRAPGETEQRDSGCLDRGARLIVDFDGGSDHQGDRPLGRQRRHQRRDAVGVDAHAEDERARRVCRLVQRVVDDDSADVHESRRHRRGRGRAGCGRGRRGRGAGSRGAAGSWWGA